MIQFEESEIQVLLKWIRAREALRVTKESGAPKPWTDDPLLRDFRWCNVRRMDDRVSQSLLHGWYSPARSEIALEAATLARLVNWPDALFEITDENPFDVEHLFQAREVLARRAARGNKVFTGAYVVPGVPGRSKVDSVMDLVQRVAGCADVLMRPTMRETWAGLVKLDGLGSFLAGQIVADVAQLPAGAHWTDKGIWAPLGPGSARGINRLLGRPKDLAVRQEQFEVWLPELIAEIRSPLAAIFEDRRLQGMDVQNCLCEFDKYRRLTLGEGKVRARYAGSAEIDTNKGGQSQMELVACA